MIPAAAWEGDAPLIAFDMDNTIVDWSSRLNEVLLELDPEFPVVPVEQQSGYDDLMGPGGDWATVARAMAHPRLYVELPFYDGAVEAVLATEAAGYPSVILTTPDVTNAECAPAKQAQIRSGIGPDWDKRIIMAHDKTLVNAEVLVDDKPVITGLHAPAWLRVMHTRPFNSHVPDQLRLDSWYDWPRVHAQALLGRGRELKDPERWSHVLQWEPATASL